MQCKKRIEYLDIAKGYLILLVILGHIFIAINPGYDKRMLILMQSFIYIFHIPAFFIIHGFFIGKETKTLSLKDYVRKAFKRQMIPYFFFEGIGILWNYIFRHQQLITGIYNTITFRCNVGACWFLPAMFLGSCLVYLFRKCEKNYFLVFSVILSAILSMFCSVSQIGIVVGRGLLAYIFILIGLKTRHWFIENRYSPLIFLMPLFLFTIIGIKYIHNDFYLCQMKDPFFFIIGGVTGTGFIIQLSKKTLSKLMSVIGKHTLSIMGTHQLVIYAFPSNLLSSNSLWGFALAIAILLFEIPVVYLLDCRLHLFRGK